MVYIIGSGPIEVMGDIIGAIEKDKEIFRTNRDTMALDACRLILGEIQRDPHKDTSDENIKRILTQLRKWTLKNPKPDMLLIQMIDTYIPPPVSDVEVETWLTFSYSKDMILQMGKSAYRIIGEAKQHFGGREINSDVIKNFIDEVLNEG